MIAQISDTLLAKKAELSQRIAAIEADFKKGRAADFAEQTSERENDEVLDEIHHEAKAELSLICHALQRIENGRYGICDSCAEKIAEQRLSALPYTTKCIDCAT
ncbi:dimethylmenaquinone methyltransferase [Thalassotalea insulae]|uniref:Dimethylmenaquinone methyltransferase n=1 Tax=Thalassotalea insulae TaxID=2056778 RepID=A0ABQ6GQU5_9GAMM|nr:TraR/DksA family transcriptional regulator [Thalassotalea insulae]GLX78330.1 dimethylmenaquinone methyltransferase [Thalassotalea insulae]